jgi:phosphoserine phosphatase RsbU/P
MSRIPVESVAVSAPFAPGSEHDLTSLHHQLDLLQREVDLLREELSIQQQRDRALSIYMTRIDEELRLAARLQQDFLPRHLPTIGRIRFHTLFRPAGYVSGDLYDVMRLDENHVGFYMADAVGHGMPAALLTMFLKRALTTKEITSQGYRLLAPGQTIARLNQALVEQDLSQAAFATAIYGTIETETGLVTFARGGHPNPILLSPPAEPRCVTVDGSLLGVFAEEQFPEQTIQLAAGERLVIYSDGIEVAFCDDRTLNTQQWRQELHRRQDLPPALLLEDLTQHLNSERGSLQPKDDLTLIVVEMT